MPKKPQNANPSRNVEELALQVKIIHTPSIPKQRTLFNLTNIATHLVVKQLGYWTHTHTHTHPKEFQQAFYTIPT